MMTSSSKLKTLRQVNSISLILCTIGRLNEVDEFLKSLSLQTHKEFEVIIVDQNEHDLIDKVVRKWSKVLKIKHLKVDFIGLSRARNYGIREASNDVLGFPDDDCRYKVNTLEKVIKFFKSKPLSSIVVGQQVTDFKQNEHDDFISCNSPQEISSILKLFKCKAISFLIFAKHSDLSVITGIFFDEALGLGAGTPWGSGEETDFLIRAFRSGLKMHQCLEIKVAHSIQPKKYIECFWYGSGRYRIIEKNRLGLKIYLVNVLQPIVRMIANNDYIHLLNYCSTALGRSGIILLFQRYYKKALSALS